MKPEPDYVPPKGMPDWLFYLLFNILPFAIAYGLLFL